MKTTTPVLLVLAAALAACSSASRNVPAYLGWSGPVRPAVPLIEGPVVPPPANDISETQRREWFDAQRPAVEPIASERIEWRDPPRCDRNDCPSWLWAIPLSLSFGYSSGGHCNNGGWGVGATWGGW